MPRQYLKGMILFTGSVVEESITSGMPILVVKFKDRHGEVYSWCPKWADLVSIVEHAKTVEMGRDRCYKGDWIIAYDVNKERSQGK